MLETDVVAVGSLAGEIWHAHYPGIITVAQIEYMLAGRYGSDVLCSELRRDDVWWDVLTEDGVLRAFSSLHLGESPNEVKLDKLYVHQDCQRRGFGARLIEYNASRARALGRQRMILAVNKRNSNAIAAYKKAGFSIEKAVVKDIGGGFVMDDYIMAYAL
jgi:GNAT superfamily N-acetyltransferase